MDLLFTLRHQALVNSVHIGQDHDSPIDRYPGRPPYRGRRSGLRRRCGPPGKAKKITVASRMHNGTPTPMVALRLVAVSPYNGVNKPFATPGNRKV